VILMVLNIQKKEHKLFVSFGIAFVYLFYTLAQTKMVSFPVIVAPLIYLGLGFFTDKVLSLINSKIRSVIAQQSISISLVVGIAFTALNLTKIQNSHTDWKSHDNHFRKDEQIEMNFINSLDKKLADSNYVIFNASITHNGNIPIMFYTDYIAYSFIPSQSQIETIRKKGKKIAILNLGFIPDYITKDEEIILLEVENKEQLTVTPDLN